MALILPFIVMKISRLLIVLAGAAVLASCTEEFDFLSREEVAPRGTVFRAHTDSPNETKTQLSENDGLKVWWSAAEAITVFDGEGSNNKFVSDNEAPASSADFVLEDSTTPVVEPDPGDFYYALYPYDSQATLEDGIIHTTYPSAFDVTRYGSFEDGMNLVVARSTSYDLSFKNLLGWIQLGFTGDEDITRIVLKGNNGEKLAGSVSIDVANLTTSVETEGSSEQLVLTGNFVSSTDRDNGCFYYIPLLPLSFSKGFTLTFYKDDGTTYSFSLSSKIDFKRGRRRNLWVDLSALQKQYTYTRVVTPSGASTPSFNDGDEYIVVYPVGDGTYKVFDAQTLLKHIEDFSWSSISLTSFLQTDDFRYGTVGIKLFNNDYITVPGNDEYITVDPGVGVVVSSKSVTLENDTASFPKSHEKTSGIKMSISGISVYQWATSSNSSLLKGTMNSDDVYVLIDQMLSRHSQYYNGTKWNLLIALGGGSLRNLVASQYNNDYSITAGYVSSEYDGTHYEGFAFKDKMLFRPTAALQKVYFYRRTPSN